MKRLLCGLVALSLMLLCGASSALALSGSPATVAIGTQAEYLSVAVDGGGNAIAAWAEKSSPGNEVVRWCVVAPGGSTCAKGGTLGPAGGKAGFDYVYNTQVLVEGPTVVILAEVDVTSTEYEQVQEWQSTDDGQTFAAVNGGKAVASGNRSNITDALSAVTLPGASLGVGFVTPTEAPTFHAFSLTNPTTCGRTDPPLADCADGFATLAPESDVDQASNEPGNFTADGNGVLGVFRTNYSSGNLGCTGGSPFGMAFVYGTGLQSPSNDYNVSPGQADTAWRNSVTLADCGVDYLAAGGGPSGFGVLEDNQFTGQTQYHRFDEATGSFDTLPVLVSSGGEQQPTVSQDGAGGVYATYLSGGIGGPVSLSYSADGGTTWAGPAALAVDPAGAISYLTSAVNPGGQGWATWVENGSVSLQQFNASDTGVPAPSIPASPPASSSSQASTSIATVQTGGGQTGPSISIPAGTAGETDAATLSGANAARATGTITYALYSAATCSAASVIASSTYPVNGASAPKSTPVGVALAPGRYYWTASYGGDSANAASTSACGSEVLTVTSPDAIAAGATSDGKTLTFGASCAVVPCTLQVAASAPASGATASSSSNRKARTVTLGKAKFKITKKGTRKLTLGLSGAGRHYLAHKRKAKVTLAVTEKIGGHNVVTKRALTVKVTHGKRR